MQFLEKLNTPGEHRLILPGESGQLESILLVPEQCRIHQVAFIGHPHSLQGGTMNNKVVTTLARVFKELNIPSLRFNFRGVGLSHGSYSDGIGESNDMFGLVKQWQREQPEVQCFFAGFSFGSFVAYRTAARVANSALITIAPPVHHYDYTEFKPEPNPWLIVQGDADEVVPCDAVLEFAKTANPSIPVIEFPDTGHFFHGKLIDLKDQLLNYLRPQVENA